MKKILFLIAVSALLTSSLSAQSNNCFDRLEKAFQERGAYSVSDDIHRNVIISFFEDGNAVCVKGKARIENGNISAIFIYFDDNTSELYDKKFYNQKKQAPTVTNGISEMIYTADGERLRVVFIEKLKPKKKQFKEAVIPDDL